MHWFRALAVFAVSLALFGAVGCGGDDDDDSGDDSGGERASAPALKVAQDPELGAILTNGDGLTLYVFTQDSAGQSACSDSCAATWPPLEGSTPPTVEGASGAFSILTRADGKKQVALNGRPLYLYAADKAAGETKGEGVGGVWFAAKANGAAPAAAASPGSTPGAQPTSAGPGSDNPYSY